MLFASIRLGLLLAMLVASLHVYAAARVWTLTDVREADAIGGSSGPVATGYFSYDDATRTISNWNVRVGDPSAVPFTAFTYVPGNSTTYVIDCCGRPPMLGFSAVMGVPGPDFGMRQLQIAALAALDGSNPTVSIATVESREDFAYVGPSGPWSRPIIAGSLALTPAEPSVVIVQVDEFYNSGLRHYFVTASDNEKQDLDSGIHAGWVRTGESFKAYATGSSAGGTINPVCRYYSSPGPDFGGVDSHFYSADAGECLSEFRKYASGFWYFESDNVFQIDLPDKPTGVCLNGTIPVYRLWNQRADSNHRYTTSTAIKAEMLVEGYAAEGYGPDGVVMCALQ